MNVRINEDQTAWRLNSWVENWRVPYLIFIPFLFCTVCCCGTSLICIVLNLHILLYFLFSLGPYLCTLSCALVTVAYLKWTVSKGKITCHCTAPLTWSPCYQGQRNWSGGPQIDILSQSIVLRPHFYLHHWTLPPSHFYHDTTERVSLFRSHTHKHTQTRVHMHAYRHTMPKEWVVWNLFLFWLIGWE